MNLEKAKIILEKINVLMRSMESSPENVAAIERDLMRNYILQFYESFLVQAGKQAEEKLAKPQKQEELPAPVVEMEVKKPTPKPEPIQHFKEEEPEPPMEDVQERAKNKKESAAPTIEEMPKAIKRLTLDDEDDEDSTPTHRRHNQ